LPVLAAVRGVQVRGPVSHHPSFPFVQEIESEQVDGGVVRLTFPAPAPIRGVQDHTVLTRRPPPFGVDELDAIERFRDAARNDFPGSSAGFRPQDLAAIADDDRTLRVDRLDVVELVRDADLAKDDRLEPFGLYRMTTNHEQEGGHLQPNKRPNSLHEPPFFAPHPAW